MQALRSWVLPSAPEPVPFGEAWDADTIDALRAEFAITLADDEAIKLARRINQEAVTYSLEKNMERKSVSHPMLVMRRPVRRSYPPGDYAKAPHWGIYEDGHFHCLALNANGALFGMSGSTVPFWSGYYGSQHARIEIADGHPLERVPVGNTSLTMFETSLVLHHVLEWFTAKHGPHTIYWNAILFLRLAATALSDAPERTWDSPVWPMMDYMEREVRAGILAAKVTYLYDASKHTPSKDILESDSYARSAACIRNEWPDRIDVEKDGQLPLCVLS